MTALRRLTRDGSARVGAVIVGVCLLAAVLGPRLAPHDPLGVTADRLRGPSLHHLLGTDGLGRDIFSRLLAGARLSIGCALVASILVAGIGLVVGLVAGFSGGVIDSALMRVVDIVLAVPGLILALAVSGLFRPSLAAVVIGLVVAWWPGYARVVRGLVVAVRERPFVEAARSVGGGRRRIMVHHILPSVVSQVIVLATLEVGQLLLAISGLTFLGLGAPPPTPEWGAMLNDGRVYFLSHPQVVLIPGLAIAVAALGFNLLGDGIRDAFDPRLVDTTLGPGPKRWRREQIQPALGGGLVDTTVGGRPPAPRPRSAEDPSPGDLHARPTRPASADSS
jgi:peptide/nickel transport system permease protein